MKLTIFLRRSPRVLSANERGFFQSSGIDSGKLVKTLAGKVREISLKTRCGLLIIAEWIAETSRELEFYEDETLPDYRLQHFFTIHG